MGLLGFADYSKAKRKEKHIHLKYNDHNYSNRNAIKYLIEYITRSRPKEDRAGELIAYGAVGVGISLDPQQMIRIIEKSQQNLYWKTEFTGRKMFHFVFNFLDSEIERLCYDMRLLQCYAEESSLVFFNMGYQVVYAIHYDIGKRYHIHYAVSAVSYLTGRKLDIGIPDIYKLGSIFNQMLMKYLLQYRIIVKPVSFATVPVRFEDEKDPRWTKTEDYVNSFRHRLPAQCRLEIPLNKMPDLQALPNYEFQGIAACNSNP